LGVPIIQFPQDIVSLQEVVHENKPDLIIETGVARGGSVIYSASLLALLDLRESIDLKTDFRQNRLVVGVDLEIRHHTLMAIESESLKDYIKLISGSSTDESVFQEINNISKNFSNPMVLLDSNHTEDHVLKELNLYSGLINSGGFIIVYDTSIEFDSNEYWLEKNRGWGKGNSPLSALKKFLSNNTSFEMVVGQTEKLGITVCPFGYIRKK
jgi:cephalosporin hydroxylase